MSSVSAHSPSGSLPHVIPAPVPNRRTSSAHQNVRMPTASSARTPPSAPTSTHPTAPQYGPRGAVSSAAMMSSADDFGAPETEPGRVGGVEQPRPQVRRGGDVVGQHALHRAHQVDQARVTFLTQQGGDLDRAGRADPLQVVADQVGDHDVLRAVLVRHLLRRGGRPLDRAAA